ncbi:hypothetical protein CYMTET_3249 [Cymbomonas tetramitiformis]|uniref:U-box domain-containing protein n=1 Tax=Cymbomonas tetramitiformis TaxID=36881 RepID=A0AAE0H3H5_9CHLO|nr:hypothetical protein CYMTET_3249 [Cymbomonas tetramitiformis]
MPGDYEEADESAEEFVNSAYEALDPVDGTPHDEVSEGLVDSDTAQETTVVEPEFLLCPITKILFQDPVFVPGSGFTYERNALLHFWSVKYNPIRDPNTNISLNSREVYTNWDKRREVHSFLDSHPNYIPQGWSSRDVPAPQKTPAGSAGQGTYGIGESWTKVAGVVGLIFISILAGTGSFAGWSELNSGNPHEDPRDRVSRSSTSTSATLTDSEEIDPTPLAPFGSRVLVERGPHSLNITFPPVGLDSAVLAQSAFAVFWTGFTGVWTTTVVVSGAPILMAAFSLPFWAAGADLGKNALRPAVQWTNITFDEFQFHLTSSVFGWKHTNVKGLIRDLRKANVMAMDTLSSHIEQFELQEGLASHYFGHGVKPLEQEYIVGVINQYINDHRHELSGAKLRDVTASSTVSQPDRIRSRL